MKPKPKTVPELRFPGFLDCDLSTVKFGKYVESNLYGPRFSAQDYDPNGNVKTIRGTDIDDFGELKYIQIPTATINSKTVESHSLQDGDLVMITTAECGRTGVFRTQVLPHIPSAYAVRYRLHKSASPYFFKYLLQTRNIRRQIASYVRKATVANLPGSDVLNIKVLNVTLPEQQKIANFLTAIDQRIQQLRQKQNLLEGGNPHTREKLDGFIKDYNTLFGGSFSTLDTKKFYAYYKDIGKKVKAGKVDILLVVNMFLTGFDSLKLNTMYVDKNLRYHGLVQAYSRTNRILNEVKSQGNIVVFRNLKAPTDAAIALFSNVKASEEIFVPPYQEYVTRFNAVVQDLLEITPTVKSVKALPDEAAELAFVKIFRELMRLRNVLTSFSEFDDEDLSLPAQRFADYRSAYLDLYDKVKTDSHKEKASILEDVDFELELIHRDVINVQYILTLLARLYGANAAEVPQIRKLILDTVASDIELRSKRELIEQFMEHNLPKIKNAAEIPESFENFWENERLAAFDQLVKEEHLDADKLKKVIDRYVYTGKEPLPDPDIIELITHPLKLAERAPTRKRVLDKVVNYVATFIQGIAA